MNTFLNISIKPVFAILLICSAETYASFADFTTEPSGSLGHSTVINANDGINLTITAHLYNPDTNEVIPGVVIGIDDGFAQHPAGIGAGESESLLNPPGLDNVRTFKELLVFEFDTYVTINNMETNGLGPHGSNINYWGGLGTFSTHNMGVKYQADKTELSFTPDAGLGIVSWFAVGAKPEESYNVFPIQSIGFQVAPNPQPVPIPAAIWLFLTGCLGLIGLKNTARKHA